MPQNNNTDNLSFDTDALFEAKILEFNNGKDLPTCKIHAATHQEGSKKMYAERFYGYLPIQIPTNENGKFNVVCRQGRTDDNWIVEISIDLDNTDFKERTCQHLKSIRQSEADKQLGIDQLTYTNFKARTVYDFKIINVTVDGDSDFFTLQKYEPGINYLHSTENYTRFAIRLLTQSKKNAEYIVNNANKISVTCEYYVYKVDSQTNTLKITASELASTKLFIDLQGKAADKYVQRGDVRKFVEELVSDVCVTRVIENPDVATTAANAIYNQFLAQLVKKSDTFAENAEAFYNEKFGTDNDYKAEVMTTFKLDTKDNVAHNTKVNAKGGMLFGLLKGESGIDVKHDITRERKEDWIGEKYTAKTIVLLRDILTAFKQAIDISYTETYLTKTTADKKTTINFAAFDYTPKKEAATVAKAPPPPPTITETINGIAIELIRVEGGTFLMGGQDNEVQPAEQPVHEVTVDTFYIGKYPITQAQWRAVMNTNPSHFRGDTLPVETVSWEDAVEFCHRLSDFTNKTYRLPTEAEWEYAARGGKKSHAYKYAGSNNIDTVAWYEQKGGATTRPVGQKNANELGLYDMSGNVWEWCNDWYAADYYKNSPANNPKGPHSGSYRVLRGGGWGTYPQYCRVAYRNSNSPTNRDGSFGFRLAVR